MKILVVEDNQTDAFLLKKHIDSVLSDCDVVIAETGGEAIDAIYSNTFSCIFIDYRLPDFSGIEILKRTYDPLTGLSPCPCILLTGENDHRVFIEAMNFGAQDYLQKKYANAETVFLSIEKARYLFNLQSEKNEIARQFSQTQKIEAMGKLTGGIAHDFNNLLTVVLGNTQMMINAVEKDELHKDYLLAKLYGVQRSAQKGADLIQHLMTFSRHRGLMPSAIHINDAISSLSDLLYQTVGRSVIITYNFSPDIWHSYIDASEFEHLLINMLANARDAMPDGGSVILSTHNKCLDTHEASLVGIEAGDYVCISVQDDGCGIEEEHLNKIFDPFFTTKDVGKGTGLGMSTAFTFARDCGGTISVRSKIGEGTVFDVYFPRHILEAEAITKEALPKNIITKGGKETILLTEDEDEIRELACMILEGHGYSVIEACHADEALTILQDASVDIDMLFTDIVMPGEMNGVQLVARALVLRPDLKILFTTGFIRDNIPDMNLLEHYTILNKPYMPHDLVQHIQDVLSG